jgi:hypothetical protein
MLETNAKWKFVTDADYENVIAGASVAAGTVQGGDEITPLSLVSGDVTFTPGVSGTLGKGGSTTSTVVTFKTETGVEGADEAEESVTFSGVVPPLLHANTVGGDQLVTTNGLTTGTTKSFTMAANPGTSERPVIIVNGVTDKKVGEFSQPRYDYVVSYVGNLVQGSQSQGITNHGCPGGV